MTLLRFHRVLQWDGDGTELKTNVVCTGSIKQHMCAILHVQCHLRMYIYYSPLASQDLDINLKLNRMSQDSLVSALPSNGWSCETLEYGIREAARMSGIELKPGQLSEAGKYREVGRNRHICYAGCSLIYFFLP